MTGFADWMTNEQMKGILEEGFRGFGERLDSFDRRLDARHSATRKASAITNDDFKELLEALQIFIVWDSDNEVQADESSTDDPMTQLQFLKNTDKTRDFWYI